MRVKFIGKNLSFMTEDGRERLHNGDERTIGVDLPEGIFAAYAHRFRLLDEGTVIPSARVMTPKAHFTDFMTHTGAGWYTVQGYEGKYRRADAEANAKEVANGP